MDAKILLGVLVFVFILSFSAVIYAASLDNQKTELHKCTDGRVPNVLDLTPGSEAGNYCYS